MRLVATVIGWFFIALAAALFLLTLASWPPGGLMFALPFVFLFPGIILAVAGLALVWAGRRRPPEAAPRRPIDR